MKLGLDNLALRKGKIMLNNIDTTTKIAKHYDVLRDKVSDGKLHDKNEYLRLLVILRAVIRGVIHQNNRANDDLRYFKRHKRLLQNKGISLIPLEKHIENASRSMISPWQPRQNVTSGHRISCTNSN